MSRPLELYQWEEQIANHFPGLSRPVVAGLALWSLGMVVVHSVQPDGGGRLVGMPPRPTFRRGARAPARQLPRGGRQGGRAPARVGLGGLLGTLAGLDAGRLGRHSARGGLGRDEPGRPLRGLGRQRALPGLRRAGRLEDPQGGREASLGAGMAGLAQAIPRRGAVRLARGRARRPRPVREMAVRRDRGTRLAPLAAGEQGRLLPPRGASQLASVLGNKAEPTGDGGMFSMPLRIYGLHPVCKEKIEFLPLG